MKATVVCSIVELCQYSQAHQGVNELLCSGPLEAKLLRSLSHREGRARHRKVDQQSRIRSAKVRILDDRLEVVLHLGQRQHALSGVEC